MFGEINTPFNIVDVKTEAASFPDGLKIKQFRLKQQGLALLTFGIISKVHENNDKYL